MRCHPRRSPAGPSYYPRVRIIARIEQVITDSDTQGTTEEIVAEAPTYEEAVADLEGRVPPGWRILNLRRDQY